MLHTCAGNKISCSLMRNEEIQHSLISNNVETLFGCSFYKNTTSRLIAPVEIAIDKITQKSVNCVIFNDVATDFIPNTIFTTFENINALLVHNNHSNTKLTSLKPYFFKKASGLTYVSIIFNTISRLSANTFGDASNLLYIDLSENMIQFISSKAFSQVHSLQGLDLHRNKIKIIENGAFSTKILPMLVATDFHHNVCIHGLYDKKSDTMKNLKRRVRSFCTPKVAKKTSDIPKDANEKLSTFRKEVNKELLKKYLQLKQQIQKLIKEISRLKKISNPNETVNQSNESYKNENLELLKLLEKCNLDDQNISDNLKCTSDPKRKKDLCENRTCWLKKNLKSCSERNLLYKPKLEKLESQNSILEKEIFLLKKSCNGTDVKCESDENVLQLKNQIKDLQGKLDASVKPENFEEEIERMDE